MPGQQSATINFTVAGNASGAMSGGKEMAINSKVSVIPPASD
jgi:hypothetical protein